MKRSIILSLTQFLLMLFVHVSAQQTEVGTLNGQLTVSPTGAAVYTIQLELPDGRGGLTPQMALQYNSQAGDGILGKGWGLSGLSYVGREAENAYYNGINHYLANTCRIDFMHDGYSIDGNRLIYIGKENNTYHKYRFEIDDASRISHYNPPPLNEEKNNEKLSRPYFIVETTQGIKKTYNAEQSFGVNNMAIRYYISKVEDIIGNEIVYNYYTNNNTGEKYLSRITYGQNKSKPNLDNSDYYEMEFKYASIPNSAHHYSALFPYDGDSYKFSVERLIDTITLHHFAGGTSSIVKEWIIDYEQAGIFEWEQDQKGKSYLKSIKLIGGDGTVLNPTVFNWEYNSIQDEVRELNNEVFDRYVETSSVAGDFNGDGFTDIAESFTYPDIGLTVRYTHANGFTTRQNVDDVFRGRMYVGDIDGNGTDELIVTSTSNKTRLYTLIDNKLKQFGSELGEQVVFLGDFNGDGLKDLITMNSIGNYFIYPGIPDLTQFTELLNKKTLSVFDQFHKAHSGNFIGNSKTCLVSITSQTAKLYQLKKDTDNEDYFFEELFNSTSTLPKEIKTVDVGDFNGDGKDDLVLSVKVDQNYKTYFFYCNGSKFVEEKTYTILNAVNWHSNPYSFADLNNDGVTDLIFWEGSFVNDNAYRTKHSIFIKSQGIEGSYGFINYDIITNTPFVHQRPGDARTKDFLIGDFNGNGEMDIMFQVLSEYGPLSGSRNDTLPLYSTNYQILQYHNLFNQSKPDDVITEVINGMGVKQKITYKPYRKGQAEQANYPILVNSKPFTLVEKIETENLNGIYYPPVEYKFEGMMTHALGKGRIGFQKSRVTDHKTNLMTETQNKVFSKNGLYFLLYPQKQQVTHIGTGKLMGRNTSEIDVKNLISVNQLIFKPVITSSILLQWDNDDANTYIGMKAVIQSINDIDTYGNSTKYSEIADEWAYVPVFDKSMHYITEHYTEYNPPLSETMYLITPQYKKTTSWSKETQSEINNKKVFDYYGNGLIETETFIPDENTSSKLVLRRKYDSYDDYGNLLEVTISAPNDTELKERKTLYGYNETGRFLEKKTVRMNSYDIEETFLFDSSTGLLKETTDARGNKTVHTYNGLGRLMFTQNPDLTIQFNIVEFASSGGNAPQNTAFMQKSYLKPYDIDEKWYEKEVYYDKFGRELRRVEKNLQGALIFIDTDYDLLGRPEFVYEPYYADKERTLFTTFSHDDLGRLNYYEKPELFRVSFSYEGRRTRQTNEATSVFKEKVVNIKGLTDWIIDPISAINYDYDGEGKLRKTHLESITTEIQYDEAGNKKEITDPNAGKVEYVHNAFGELIEQTDAKGNHYIMDYDESGRQLSLLINNTELTTYEYYDDKNANGFGLIKSQSNSINGCSTSYKYDKLGRLYYKNDIINDKSFIFTYSYNPNSGMLETYQFPSEFKLKYSYNSSGHINQVIDDATSLVLWHGISQNQRGQLVDQDFGNGVKNEKYFDEYGYLQSDIVSNRDIFQHFDYKYNYVTGNLAERSDRRHGHTENFEYDDQLQKLLKSWTINDATSYSMDYANNGNILRKSDVSTEAESYQYQEPQGKPHAVSQIVNPTDDFLSKFTWQEIDYNSFNKIESITQPFYGPSVDRHRLRFTYGTDQSRRKMDYYFVGTDDTEIIRKSKYYLDNFESVVEGGVTKNYHYIHSPDGLFGIMVANEDKKEFYYIHTDHLGSITAVTNREGTLLQSLSYDPWGRRRNPNDWADYSVSATMFDRGFTGHEHLDEFGLINMNGRVYDPYLARFLSPDPFITEPHNAQNYNRYSYALNNPLRYTDPSGYYHEFWDQNDRARLHIAGSSGAYGTVDWSHHMRTGGMGPGSGNHWSDQFRSEWGNFMLGNQRSYDRMYGTGAYKLAIEVYSNPVARNQWMSGSVSLDKGFWMESTRSYGDSEWHGFSSSRNQLTGVEVINKFVRFNGTSGRVEGGDGNEHLGAKDWFDKTIIGIESYSFAHSSKEELIKYAAKTDPSLNNLKYVKGVKVVGKVLVVGGVIATGYEVYDDVFNKGNYYSAGTRAAVLGIGFAATAIPFAGWALAGGIGLADAIWGDQFYNWVELNLRNEP